MSDTVPVHREMFFSKSVMRQSGRCQKNRRIPGPFFLRRIRKMLRRMKRMTPCRFSSPTVWTAERFLFCSGELRLRLMTRIRIWQWNGADLHRTASSAATVFASLHQRMTPRFCFCRRRTKTIIRNWQMPKCRRKQEKPVLQALSNWRERITSAVRCTARL